MPAWKNKALILFHGTDDVSLGAVGVDSGIVLKTFKVNLLLCRPHTDFGQGFYLTTSDFQAKQWANSRVLRRRKRVGPAPSAVVLSFSTDRDAVASLDALTFVRPIPDCWDLVSDCRHGFAPHQRSGPTACYDIVSGPVTLWPQRLTIADCDQFSFHTQRAVNCLRAPVLLERGINNGLF